ncbi:hypothetical protein F2P81_005457 [Scophthalmus maximus]|uniref:Uncharacterized protein n=1 Tax=Scophthalmus maximus TaxID=52904 RepID=A0A6A4T9P7_SCOMX|nr:hypothetical protein F2P81_005457 [Scophthalmus maximus]
MCPPAPLPLFESDDVTAVARATRCLYPPVIMELGGVESRLQMTPVTYTLKCKAQTVLLWMIGRNEQLILSVTTHTLRFELLLQQKGLIAILLQ